MTIRENPHAVEGEGLIFVSGVSPLVRDQDVTVINHDRLLTHRCKRMIFCGGIVKVNNKLIHYTAKFAKAK
jgi:hypothetical protein